MVKIIVDIQFIKKGEHGSKILKVYKDGSCEQLICSNNLVERLMKRARSNMMFS